MSKCNVCEREFALGYHSANAGVCGNCMVDHPERYIELSDKSCRVNGWPMSSREHHLEVVKGFKEVGFGSKHIEGEG